MSDLALTAIVRLMPDGSPITLKGRLAWAILQLTDAGTAGCTPLENPGPRWSGYIHKLRTAHGFTIETVTKSHDGPFAGHHTRYILRSEVEIVHRSDCAAERAAA
jgi:hypothetical protein